MTDQFANAAITTLNGAITSGAGALVLTSATLFPASGTFDVFVDNEIMLCTAVAGTTLTVTRGTQGTTAVAHADMSVVRWTLTARTFAQLKSDILTSASVASWVGTRFFAVDYDNGNDANAGYSDTSMALAGTSAKKRGKDCFRSSHWTATGRSLRCAWRVARRARSTGTPRTRPMR